jgi:hypothetical protein
LTTELQGRLQTTLLQKRATILLQKGLEFASKWSVTDSGTRGAASHLATAGLKAVRRVTPRCFE